MSNKPKSTNAPRKQPPKRKLGDSVISWISQTTISGATLALLLFILVNFYVFSSIISIDSFLLIFLIITGATDGLFVYLQLIQKGKPMPKPKLDPAKVTAVIACYNGEDVIGETIDNLLRHLPPENIIVVSDASTDRTAEVAEGKGVRVIVNKKNLHKAFSVSVGVYEVKTEYVLLLDDDVLIGNAIIPTNYMDKGYSAVAFDVMPIRTDTFVNMLQTFEYRNSMQIGKNLHAMSNSIGNISGAIGLYRTEDLKNQAYLHSGQFAGEDEQRTLLTHIYSEGKGVVFCDQTVRTLVPNTFHALYQQRAYSWSLSVPEQFMLYMRILLSPRYHYLLKAEKAYAIYIYLTDPLRLLFLWTLFLRPKYLLFTFGVYLVINTLAWLHTGRKDPFLAVLVSPFYTLWLTLCRFIGNFYWFKVKFLYFRKKLHRNVEHRRMVAEFCAVFAVFLLAWGVSGFHFFNDVQLFQKILASKLNETSPAFQYDSDTSHKITDIQSLHIRQAATPPAAGTYVAVTLQQGDTLRAVAHRAVDGYTGTKYGLTISYEQRKQVDKNMLAALQTHDVYYNAQAGSLMIDNSIMEEVVHP